jgi:hypothetical protein
MRTDACNRRTRRLATATWPTFIDIMARAQRWISGCAPIEPRRRPQGLRPQDPSSRPDNEIIFLREDDEDDANEASPTIQFMSPKGDTNEA